MDPIVRRLMQKPSNLIKESISNSHILNRLSEAEKDEDEEDIKREEIVDDTSADTPPEESEIEETPEESEESEEEESSEEKDSSEEERYNVNPLDNPYAVRYTIGDEIVVSYSNGTRTKLGGVVDGYDKEGFYRIRWNNGLTTNGITDLALLDAVKHVEESVCICGSKDFITENSDIVCDKCGRSIRGSKDVEESTDVLTIADKSRPKGKKLIRSEAHPISTATASADIVESEDSPKLSIEGSIRKAFSRK